MGAHRSLPSPRALAIRMRSRHEQAPWDELRKKAEEMVPHDMTRPVMDNINMIRTKMCWQRPNLPQHEKCLRFLGLMCTEGSTGEGICSEYKVLVGESCQEGGADIDKDLMCELAADLGVNVKKDDGKSDENAE